MDVVSKARQLIQRRTQRDPDSESLSGMSEFEDDHVAKASAPVDVAPNRERIATEDHIDQSENDEIISFSEDNVDDRQYPVAVEYSTDDLESVDICFDSEDPKPAGNRIDVAVTPNFQRAIADDRERSELSEFSSFEEELEIDDDNAVQQEVDGPSTAEHVDESGTVDGSVSDVIESQSAHVDDVATSAYSSDFEGNASTFGVGVDNESPADVSTLSDDEPPPLPQCDQLPTITEDNHRRSAPDVPVFAKDAESQTPAERVDQYVQADVNERFSGRFRVDERAEMMPGDVAAKIRSIVGNLQQSRQRLDRDNRRLSYRKYTTLRDVEERIATALANIRTG